MKNGTFVGTFQAARESIEAMVLGYNVGRDYESGRITLGQARRRLTEQGTKSSGLHTEQASTRTERRSQLVGRHAA